MNTSEKLEQGAIVKEKGTQYFKVGVPLVLLVNSTGQLCL